MRISAYNGSVSLALKPSFHSINSRHGKYIMGLGVSISSPIIDTDITGGAGGIEVGIYLQLIVLSSYYISVANFY